jgi:hypothetical protein
MPNKPPARNTSAMGELVSILSKDAKSPRPKYPSQSAYAVQNENVAKALTRRLEQGAKVRNIRALEYDFVTGLNRICFELEHAGPMLSGDDILVLLDANCAVVGVVDPFDSKQPNRTLPPLAAFGGGAMPFVLERPSVSANLPFGEADIAPGTERAREFMARMIGPGGWGRGGGGFFDGDPCGPEAVTTNCTFYSPPFQSIGWLSPTRYDRSITHVDPGQMDTVADDCGMPLA